MVRAAQLAPKEVRDRRALMENRATKVRLVLKALKDKQVKTEPKEPRVTLERKVKRER